MGKQAGLGAKFVETVKEPGRYVDGGGLLLEVRKRGERIERVYAFSFTRGSRGSQKRTWISLGPSRDISLATARDMARACREALALGEDPKLALNRSKNAVPTFGVMADQLVDDIAPGFKSQITVRNWHRTLGDAYCATIRKKPVDEITTDDILALLRPHWQAKPETATKVRERIERVLDVAEAKGFREGKNPARWKGHLKLMLPAQKAKKGHFRALPWQELPAFVASLRTRDSVSALALEWTILTAVRTSMTLECPVAEISRANKLWVIPGERMKEGREHRVPLVDRCIEIMVEMEPFGSKWLFPARDPRETLSNMAMAECLREFDVDATVHGFRSTFSDWAHDATEFDSELIEQALSHVTGNAVKLAYRRGDALDRRRELMQAWTSYCLSAVPKVRLAGC